MSTTLGGKTVQQLMARGWTVLNDASSNEFVGVRSDISQWNSLTWAERTYYGAKYGFNEWGTLEIWVSHQVAPTTSLHISAQSSPNQGDVVVPENRRRGSNRRLRALLQEGRVTVERSRYDDTALAHYGADGTTVITAEHLWGLPSRNRDTYVDLDIRYTCMWEISSDTWCPDPPWWAIGPNVEQS